MGSATLWEDDTGAKSIIRVRVLVPAVVSGQTKIPGLVPQIASEGVGDPLGNKHLQAIRFRGYFILAVKGIYGANA